MILFFLGGYGHYIPLAALAGILIVVAVQMISLKQISLIIRTKRSDAIIFLVTLFLTLVVDLVTAIEVGVIFSIILIVKKMSESNLNMIILKDQKETKKHKEILQCSQIVMLEMDHPFFFAAASDFAHKLNKILNNDVRVLILRMKHMDFIDTTGITILQDIVENFEKKGGIVIFSRMQKGVFETIKRAKIKSLIDEKHYANRTRTAINMAMKYVDPLVCKNACNKHIVKECSTKKK